jgi:hypothetical protein
MRFVPRWITKSLTCGGLVLSGAMLVLACGCSEEGPGVSGDPSKAAAPTESFADKRPKEVEDGTAKKGGRPKGQERVKGVSPTGAQ